jgi:hypothetical protein
MLPERSYTIVGCLKRQIWANFASQRPLQQHNAMSQPRIPPDFPIAGLKSPGLTKRVINRLIKGLAALAIFFLVGLTMLFALLWREHKTEIKLPNPTGQFAVGRTTFDWVNNLETDELSPSQGEKREVAVWIWYPAAAPALPADYLPTPWRLALEQYSGILMGKFLVAQVWTWLTGGTPQASHYCRIRTHVLRRVFERGTCQPADGSAISRSSIWP